MEKYTKVKTIGKGNMGTCALARNNEDGKYYVIKQVDLTRMSKKDRQQSLNEARVLSSLRHPNIINYVDSFLARKSDNLCIVMEYAESGDVSTRLKRSYGASLPERQVLDWFIQLVLSLDYVHQRKILHRDVKTQNVFLTNENLIKLGDFGIARTLANTYDQAQTFVGTPYYLSPELILERPYDHRSDVWALGVVLYELLALKHPFNAKDMKGLLQRILAVQYDPLPSTYSPELRDIVARMLVRDPAHRIELQDILRLPVVRARIQQWIKDDDTVPRHYVRSLCKHRLLPGITDSTVGLDPAQSAGRAAAAAAAVAHDELRPLRDGGSDHADPHGDDSDGGSGARGSAGRCLVSSTAARAAAAGCPAGADGNSAERGRPVMPPLKPFARMPALPSTSPPPYAPPLPAVLHRVPGNSNPTSAPPLPPAAAVLSTPSTARSAAIPLPRPHSDVQVGAAALAPAASQRASVRSKVAQRSYARPYVAQSHASPSPYLGDVGAAIPPGYLLLANPRKNAGDVRRQQGKRTSNPYVNPVYRAQRQGAPAYRQLAPLPPTQSDIKAMLHRAAADRARRLQEFT